MSDDVSQEAAPEVAPEVVEESAENQENSEVANAPADLSADQAEAAQDIADAVDAGEITEAEAVAAIRKLTLKVDGQEIEKEIPFDVTPEMEEFLRKELQLAAASQKRMQEAAELKKSGAQRESELEAFLGRLGNEGELDEILKHFGHDPASYAEKVLARELEKMEMSPEQRELAELRAEMKRIEDAKVAAEEAQKQAEFKAIQDRISADTERDLLNAMEAGDLPSNPYNVREVANYMLQATNRGIDVSAAEIVEVVKSERNAHVRNTLSGLSADQILEILGEKQVNDIVLKRAPKEKKVVPPTADSVLEGAKEPKEDKYKSRKRTQSLSDWMRPNYRK